jgi:hypothetical protein
MALVIYPDTGYDSFVTLVDADAIIANYSVHNDKWVALTDTDKEIYLRIACEYIILNTPLLPDMEYDPLTSCLPKSNAMMAVHDLSYGLSSEINPNTGLISKEKVDTLEVTYFHGNPNHQVNSRKTSRFPATVVRCINSYGGNVRASNVGVVQETLGHS